MTDEAKPYPKAQQLARGERRYRRKVASAKQWQRIAAEKQGPCRVCRDPASNGASMRYIPGAARSCAPALSTVEHE